MPFETKLKKKFRKRTDKKGNVILDSLWQSVDMDEMSLPQTDHLSMTLLAFKKQSNLFVRRLFRAGAFQKFSPAEQKNAEHGWTPKGYEVALKIPLRCGGNYHLSNFILMPKGYREILYDLYFKQVAKEIENLPDQKKVFLTLPHLPDFITPETFANYLFPEDRKLVSDYLKKQKIQHLNSSQLVKKSEQGKKVFLELRKQPFFPFPCTYQEVRIHLPNLMEREEIWRQYSHEKEKLLLQAVERGDFDFLGKKEKERLIKTHQLSLNLKLTCHHILPRHLGGQNTLENIVWMGEENHKKLHQEALNPLVQSALIQMEKDPKKEIYILLPVPSAQKQQEKEKNQAPPKIPFRFYRSLKKRYSKS